MPAILTHKAIMLLARERVADIRDRLLLKKALGRTLTDLELRLLRLATLTHIMMSDADDEREPIATPDEADWPDGFGRGVSRFAVMGCMGPDIPSMSAALAPGQGIWFDIVHKGTPDSQREQLNARTTDFALEIHRRASLALADRPADGVEAAHALQRARDQVRAYVLGHLTHLAGDIIAHPFINDVEWHVPPRQASSNPFSNETLKFGHERTEGSLDTRVAIEVFRRQGPRSGQPWSAWWPTVDEVPPELFIGWERAFEEIYRSKLGRPLGLAAFEDAIASLTPPVPDADFIRDGYRMMTKGGVGMVYDWGYASWLGFLSVAVLPVLATFPLAFALPRGNDLFSKGAGEAGERASFEALTLPLALNAIWPIVYGAVIAGVTWRGAETIATVGLFGSALGGMAGFIFLVTLLAPDPGAEWRWILLFALPVAIGFSLSIAAIVKSVQHEKRRRILLLIFAAPFLIALVAGLLLFVFAELIGAASEDAGAISWGVVSGLIVVGGLLLLFIVLPFKARDARLPEKASAFPAQRPHHVRLFDRSSLFERPNQGDPVLTEAHYPSGIRPLLRMWWTGAGDLFVRPRRTHIEYMFARDGSAARIVPAPITPMTQRQLATYLTNAVKDSGGAAGVLQCALVHEADAEVEIPPGAVFADHGDIAESADSDAPEFALSEAAAEFRQLTTGNDDDSYTLYHGPKRAQAVRFDRFGPVPFEEREVESVDGAGSISGSGTTISGIGTAFRFFFQPGDRVVFNGQARVVTKIDGDLQMVISSPFKPPPDGAAYQRLGTTREQERGYSFVAQPRGRSGTGDTIMDFAGDLGALFCLSGASQMLDGSEKTVPDMTGMVDAAGQALAFPDIGPAVRVLQNWSLDRRLVDEWREAVLGGALMDDSAAASPGQRTLLEQGWVHTLRKWLRVVDAHGHSALDATLRDAGANEPTNQELSLAMAHLLSMSEPVVVQRAP